MSASAWRLLSLLLDYPDDELLAAGPELRAAALALEPSPARARILDFLSERERLDAASAQRRYVECFDFAARSTLYLTYHLYGDRRERGPALLRLKRACRSAGFELAPGTMPDHLPVLLELADLAPQAGVEALRDLRPALEVVRSALHEQGSSYAGLLDAVCELLPAATAEELSEARRIAAEGPPRELVGLEPFALAPAACEPAPAAAGAACAAPSAAAAASPGEPTLGAGEREGVAR